MDAFAKWLRGGEIDYERTILLQGEKKLMLVHLADTKSPSILSGGRGSGSVGGVRCYYGTSLWRSLICCIFYILQERLKAV